MASLSKRRGNHRARPVMNVTPLVDVVLVLLIIFMVVIPALAQGMNIEIPSILNVDDANAGEAEPFILSITNDGEFFFDQDPMAASDLVSTLEQARTLAPGRRLVIRADQEVRYAQLRSIYRTVQEIGFPGLSLRVNRRQAEGGEAAPAGAGG